MDGDQRCGNCGYLGKTFPWCRQDRKAVKVTDGAECTKWCVLDSGEFRPKYIAAPVVQRVQDPNPSPEKIETDHETAINENMKREALKATWVVAHHAGYLHGIHARIHLGGGGVNYELVANPYTSGEPKIQWADGFRKGLNDLPEQA